MPQVGGQGWAEQFDDLRGQPDRYVDCTGEIGMLVARGYGHAGGPGILIRLQLPDGRAALAATDLLAMIEGFMRGLDLEGYRIVLGLADRFTAPERTDQ